MLTKKAEQLQKQINQFNYDGICTHQQATVQNLLHLDPKCEAKSNDLEYFFKNKISNSQNMW